MDVLKRLNDAIEYAEKHLCDDIVIDEVARIALAHLMVLIDFLVI